ncbi:MAG: UDP-glucose 4-epimerase, partial [Methanomassiliicoccales archaeon]
EVADIVVEEMGLESVGYSWTGGVKQGRGWLGDVRVMLLSIDRLREYGWCPRYGSSQAIRRAAREILS